MTEQLVVIPIEIWQIVVVFIALHTLVIGGVLIGLLIAILKKHPNSL